MVFVQGDVSTGLTRELASLMRSVAMATVPKITLVTGHTHGHAYLAMNGQGLQPDMCYHWPTARISCLDNDASSADASSTDAWESSSNMICDDVILPSETREVLRLSLVAAGSFPEGRGTVPTPLSEHNPNPFSRELWSEHWPDSYSLRLLDVGDNASPYKWCVYLFVLSKVYLMITWARAETAELNNLKVAICNSGCISLSPYVSLFITLHPVHRVATTG
eukprot:sb/3469798/